jgi:hypothetical protein
MKEVIWQKEINRGELQESDVHDVRSKRRRRPRRGSFSYQSTPCHSMVLSKNPNQKIFDKKP